MPTYLSLTVFGVFVLDDEGKVTEKHMFYPDADIAATNLMAVNDEDSTDLLESITKNLQGVDVVVEDPMFARTLSKIKDFQVRVEAGAAPRWFRDGQDDYLISDGIVPSNDDISSFRRDVSIRLAKSKISAASEEKDLLVKNAIDAVDEIDKSINLLAMRLREWYSLHHPSLSRLVEDQEQFARILNNCTGKSAITKECIESAGVSLAIAEQIMNALTGDIGAEFAESDLIAIGGLAKTVDDLYKMRSELEEYVNSMMSTIAPNISALAGPLIGARLISLAGSLKELARKPSSTVQVFGAEKALFRSLKTGADPPKHGIIYRVAEVNTAPYWQRGKIARSLAGKLSIAARIDAYSEKNVGEKLREEFMSRVEEIRRQNPEAPPPKPRPPPTLKKKHSGRGGRPKRRREGGGRQY
ncbi:MAG: C/D box methylation guide ribonucleoprotein complex aNOP56 subunit [Candidatus Thorarchaeota archaeon]